MIQPFREVRLLKFKTINSNFFSFYRVILACFARNFDLLRNSRPNVSIYADGRELLVFRTFLAVSQRVEKPFRHAEGPSHNREAASSTIFCFWRTSGLQKAHQHGGDLRHTRGEWQIEAQAPDALRNVATYARANKEDFEQLVMQTTSDARKRSLQSGRTELDRIMRRTNELDTLLQKPYEDYALGRLPEKRHAKLSAQYEAEQAQ